MKFIQLIAFLFQDC